MWLGAPSKARENGKHMSHSDSTETPGQAWSPQRSSREAIQSQFGASRAELALWALTTGDPLADAVVKEIHHGGYDVRTALSNGMRFGFASLSSDPRSGHCRRKKQTARVEGEARTVGGDGVQ